MINETLVNNLLLDLGNIVDSLDSESKSYVIKCYYNKVLDEICSKLKDKFKDVNFTFSYTNGNPAEYIKNGNPCVYGFDSPAWYDEDSEDSFHQINIEQLGVKLEYTWIQTCNLGHTHTTTRFHCYSLPKVSEIVHFYVNNPSWIDQFVEQYLPNFFYTT